MRNNRTWIVVVGIAVALAIGAAVYEPLRTDLAFWGVLTFIVFLWVCKKMLWRWWYRSMTDREQQERRTIEKAERENRQARQLLEEHRTRMENLEKEIDQKLAEARERAEQARQNILNEAHREAEAAKERALAEIERSKEQALKELFDAMANQVATATEDLIGQNLKADDQDRLVEETLEQLGNRQSD